MTETVSVIIDSVPIEAKFYDENTLESQLRAMQAEDARAAAVVAETGAELARDAAVAGASSAGYRPTIAGGVADFTVGQYFTSDDQGEVTAHPNELRLYLRIVGSPFYLDQGDEAAPVGRALLGKPDGATRLGMTRRGSVAPSIIRTPQDWRDMGLDLYQFEEYAESGKFEPGTDGTAAVAAWLNAGLELVETIDSAASDPGFDPNFRARALSNVDMRLNGTGGGSFDAINHVMITSQLPYLPSGCHLIGSPDTVLTAAADGLQLLRTIDGTLAQTVWQNGSLQPYGSYRIRMSHLLVNLAGTASDGLHLQTLAEAFFNDVHVWGGIGSAWSMSATSTGTNVLTVGSTAGIREGQVIHIGGINLPSGQPRRFGIRDFTGGDTILLDKPVPAGTYTISHRSHQIVGQMLQQAEFHGVTLLGGENSEYYGTNGQGFGCTDVKFFGGKSDYHRHGRYESAGCVGMRCIGRSSQYHTVGSEFIFDQIAGVSTLDDCWNEVTSENPNNETVPVIEAVDSSLLINGHDHASNGFYKLFVKAKDSFIDGGGFKTGRDLLPANPGDADDFALAEVDGGSFHMDWGSNFTNTISGVPLYNLPDRLVKTVAGANFGNAIASTSGLPTKKVTTRSVEHRVTTVTDPILSGREAGKAHPGVEVNGRGLRLRDGDNATPFDFYADAFSVNVAGNNLNIDSGRTYRVAGQPVLGARISGCPAAATDLASAITLVNFLRSSGLTHGGIG